MAAESTSTAADGPGSEVAHGSGNRPVPAPDPAPVGVFDWDVVHDRFGWSPWHDRLWDFEAGEFDGTYAGLGSRVHRDDRQDVSAELFRCMNTRDPFGRDFRIVRRDRGIRWIAVRGEFSFDAGGRPFRMRGSMLDITAHKETEARLRASEASLATAQAMAHLGHWELELATNDGTFSAEMFRLLHRDPAQGVPTFAEFVQLAHPDDRPALERIRARIEELSGPLTVEYRTDPSRGTVRHISATIQIVRDRSGRPARATGTALDITERKQAELASRRLAAIVESSEDGIISLDRDEIVVSWNRGAERIFGYSAAEMTGTSVLRIVPAELQEQETEFLRRTERGEAVDHYETERRTKDGRRIHLSIAVSPIRDAYDTIVGASMIARDVTLLKERERELARLSRLYEGLSQVSQAIVWATTRQNLFDRICPALVQQAGFCMAWVAWCDPKTHRLMPVAQWGDRDELFLRTIRVYADDRPEGRGPSGVAFREGRPSVCNDVLQDPSLAPWREQARGRGFRAAAAFPIRESGIVRGTLTVYADEPGFFRDKERGLLMEAAADISFGLDNLAREEERRRVETVARSEKRFSDTIIESTPGVLYLYDEHGRFLRWNRNFEQVSGYSKAEIEAMRPTDFFPEQDRPLVQRRIREVFEKGDSSVEADFLRKDGGAVAYSFTGRRVELDGAPCLVGMGTDISERKRAELALRELNETLELKVARRTEELRAAVIRAEAADRVKSAFLATMSHELRTPLNSIIGFTGILLQRLAGPLNEEQVKQLGMVQSSARHLLELINDVLDLSKIEANQLRVRSEPFDLRSSLAGAVAAMKPLAEKKGLSLTACLSPALGEIVSDRRRVEQVLLNLLNNAVKFTEHGGVRVEAEVVEIPSRPGLAPRPAVRVSVGDTGIGITPEDLATLFQPFQQIDTGLTRKHEGTGLGLAICRRLVDLLGGTIAARSQPGKGSDFAVTLPLEREPAK